MNYNTLQWDSNHFGFKVVRIQPNLKEDQLLKTVQNLSLIKCRLAYYLSDDEINREKELLKNAKFVDVKTTFSIDIKKKELKEISTSEIKPYNSSMLFYDFNRLVAICGKKSRFCVDQSIPRDKFLDLYRIWIEKSISKELADELFVVEVSNKVVGLITLVKTNQTCKIGLLAVDDKFKGNGYGSKLTLSAINWAKINNFNSVEVVTQESNAVACHIYSKCGFKVVKKEYCYHIWL